VHVLLSRKINILNLRQLKHKTTTAQNVFTYIVPEKTKGTSKALIKIVASKAILTS
jgi:hypothetical protein